MNNIRRQTASVLAVQGESGNILPTPVAGRGAKTPCNRKARNFFCYVLDLLSLVALAVAGIALLTAMYSTAGANEAALFGVFHQALVLAVSGFLVARSYQIVALLWNEPQEKMRDLPAQLSSGRIEVLADHKNLERAA
jgi:hypothetical protein